MKRSTGGSHLAGEATRRDVLVGAVGLAALVTVSPARATPGAMQQAIREFTGGGALNPSGMELDIPALVENGNAVPLTIRVESAMAGDDFVKSIAVFNEKNPQTNICVFHLSQLSGRAAVSTRIRLGDSQTIVAIAAMADGSFRTASAELVVTLPACVEE